MANQMAGFRRIFVVEYGKLTVETPLALNSAMLEITAENGAVLVVDEIALIVKKYVSMGAR